MNHETTAQAQSLHDQIMRLPCIPPKDANVNQMLSYKYGHRAARHAAAELAAAHEAGAQQPRNSHGIDAHYFHKKLGLVLRDFDSLMPDELARTLARLAKVADEAVLLEAEFAGPPAQRSQLPDGYVLMPKALTAENGAKALLAGEFSIAHVEGCHGCDCTGGEDDEPCAYCGGTGEVVVRVSVDWPTIKAIYAKAVEHFAPGGPAAPEQAGPRLAISSQEQLAALLNGVQALHEISAELIAECVFEQIRAANSDGDA